MLKTMRDRLAGMLYKKIIHPVNAESYTVMPRFALHQPLDYKDNTLPPEFGTPLAVLGEALLVPAGADRFGYATDDTDEYLRWGRVDHDLLLGVINKYYGKTTELHIMDFGCSSGRVLRHFELERAANQWTLYGVDLQARAIEWMRRNFPPHYQIATSSLVPHLPFADNSLDVIYGISVFTHIKYLWDAWLLELRRVLKPDGLLIQTVHTETAWNFYRTHKEEDWVRKGFPAEILNSDGMDVDFLYHGDIRVSQVFWKREIVRDFWGRYFSILEITDPPERSFQDWVICRKAS